MHLEVQVLANDFVVFLSLLITFSTLFPMSFSTLFYPFSPRLDDIGNSVRGVEFCKLIAKRFSFHAFAPLTEDTGSNKEVEEYLAKASKQKNDQLKEEKQSGVVVTETTTSSLSPSEMLKSPGSPRSESRRLSRRNSWIAYPEQAQEDRRWDPRRHDERKNTEHQTEEENALEMLWAAYV